MFWKKKVVEEKPVVKPQGPPLTAEEFVKKYSRGYLNYGALLEAAFALDWEEEYDRMSKK